MEICKIALEEERPLPFEIVFSDLPLSRSIHTHVYYEMLYVLEGSVMVTIRGRDFRADAGSLVFLNQFDEHATRMITDVYRRYYLLIPHTQLKAFHSDAHLLSVFRFHGDKFPYVLQVGEDKRRFDTYFDLLIDTAGRGGAYMDQRVEALLTLIFTDVVALRPDMFIPEGKESLLPMQAILDEQDRGFAVGFSLNDLSSKYHVSPGCLSAHFRQHVGISPMQYITQRRLAHAKELLLKTDLPVLEISSQCGYGDVSNFVRRFRQQFQMTPLKFRRQRAGQAGKARKDEIFA